MNTMCAAGLDVKHLIGYFFLHGICAVQIPVLVIIIIIIIIITIIIISKRLTEG